MMTVPPAASSHWASQPRPHGYTDGLLSSVGNPTVYASEITYHPNGMLKSVTHGEGSQRVFETWTADPDGMSRPSRIAATNTAGAELWSTGNYAYDGAGNIKSMGQTSYRYDAFQRLLQSTTVTPPGKSTMTDYGYDSFGNRLYETGRTCTAANGRITCGSPTYLARAVTGTTNHYADATYDAAGNVTTDRGRTFSYDPLGMMTRAQVETGDEGEIRDFHYLYTADDERIAVVERINAKNKTTWSVRDFDNRVLRLWTDDKTSGTRVITWKEDPVYRGNALLANVSPTGTKHYSLDHLGSPRLVTEVTGAVKGLQSFSDFGTGGTSDGGALQYTGHERDMATFGSGTADLPDYFHARYYDFATGRFLSVDPAMDVERNLRTPQRWNRYAYAVNNPIKYVDPDGMTERTGWQAGVVVNNSDQVIWIAGDHNGVKVIPLRKGERSTSFLVDTDAVIIGPGQKIDGEMTGAIKIGSSDVDVEGRNAGKLELNADGEWIVNAAVGRAGHVSTAMAKQEGWVAPSGRQEVQAAERTKQQLQQERQREEQKNKPQPQPRPQPKKERDWWPFW